ncbi:MAG: hypothetical protein R3D71_00050 [Rickettsiales bacterium]
MSNKNTIKEAREKKVFQSFLATRGLDGKFESRQPPDPDIFYEHPELGSIAFELVEICAEEVKSEVSKLLKSNDDVCFIRSGHEPHKQVFSKLSKQYVSEYPIELLCYIGGMEILPTDVIISQIEHFISNSGTGFFQKIWVFDGSEIYCFDKKGNNRNFIENQEKANNVSYYA